MTKPIEKKFDVEEEIRDKFAGIGVEVKGMKTITDSRGKFDKSLVEISKVNLKLIWGRRLGLKNCCVVAFEGLHLKDPLGSPSFSHTHSFTV